VINAPTKSEAMWFKLTNISIQKMAWNKNKYFEKRIKENIDGFDCTVLNSIDKSER
jgi:hypothetical protein